MRDGYVPLLPRERDDPSVIRDLTDDEARLALPVKWGSVEPDVLPAWVAEMDFAPPDAVTDALAAAVGARQFGYPGYSHGIDLAVAYAGFASRHYSQSDLRVLPVVDVTAGLRFALDVLSERAPVIVPMPAYGPHHTLAQITGRERVDLTVGPEAPRAELDVDQLDHLFRSGARTLLLTQPHNPWGRVFTRAELEGIRDVVVAHGARVISDEIHAPLVLPGAEHVSYLSIDGTHDHAVAVVAASKAFNTAGLRCAQLVVPSAADRQLLVDQPMSRNDSHSPVGVVAARAAYDLGDPWLASLVERLDQQRALLGELLATHLPEVRMRPLEATYLAWLDASAYGHDDAAAVALERGRVQVSPGESYAPGTTGQVRLNIATSPDRLTDIVERLAKAWT